MRTVPSLCCRLLLTGLLTGGLLQACDFKRMAEDRPVKLPEESFEPAGPQLTTPEGMDEASGRDGR